MSQRPELQVVLVLNIAGDDKKDTLWCGGNRKIREILLEVSLAVGVEAGGLL